MGKNPYYKTKKEFEKRKIRYLGFVVCLYKEKTTQVSVDKFI